MSSDYSPTQSEVSTDESAPLLDIRSHAPSEASESAFMTPETKNANEARSTMIGMLCVAVGIGLVCTVGALVQSHGGSVLELMEGRYLVQNVVAMVWWRWFKPKGATKWYGDPPHRANVWVRGALYWAMIFAWWRGLELVAIGDAEAILFTSPVLTVLVARWLLKEKLPKSTAITLVMTIAGVVFICQPPFIFGGDDYQPVSWQGLAFLSVSVFSWTAINILVRTAKEAHWLQLELVSSGQAFWLWTPVLILLNRVWWQSDSLSGGEWDYEWSTFALMFALGAMGFGGLCLYVIGYQLGDATKVAWMEYLDLIFAFLYQWGVFGGVPNKWELIGAVLLLSTCVIHVTEELYHFIRSRNKEETSDLDFAAVTVNEETGLGSDQFIDDKQSLLASFDNAIPIEQSTVDKKLSKHNKFVQMINRLTTFKTDHMSGSEHGY